MRLAIISKERREEWKDHQHLHWVQSVDDIKEHSSADAVIDLEFDLTPERINSLKQCPGTVIVNSNLYTLQEINAPFVRINGWPGFIKGSVEAYAEAEQREKAEQVFASIHTKVEWLPDQVGFVTPRVISMIINEAFFALAEGVSTKEEIDTAMKLGTAYPYGPFEWAESIGLKNICDLLQKLGKDQARYTPAPLLADSTGK